MFFYKKSADAKNPYVKSCFRIAKIHLHSYEIYLKKKIKRTKIKKTSLVTSFILGDILFTVGDILFTDIDSETNKKHPLAQQAGKILFDQETTTILKSIICEYMKKNEYKEMIKYLKKGSKLGNNDCINELEKWNNQMKELGIYEL